MSMYGKWTSDTESESDNESDMETTDMIYMDEQNDSREVMRDALHEALDKYYELKMTFNHSVQQDHKRRMALMKQRKSHTPQLPCINCWKKSAIGTKFACSYHPEEKGNSGYRILSAKCGDLQTPCNLNIEIHLAEVVSVDAMLQSIQEEIRLLKQEIVCDKNRLLFNVEKEEEVVGRFQEYKEQISELGKNYEAFFRQYMSVVHNVEKRDEMDAKLVEAYTLIEQIKQSIRLLLAENDRKYAQDAVHIYTHQLQNVLAEIRKLKYNRNAVQSDSVQGCVLVQSYYTPNQFEVAVGNIKSQVVKFDFGRTLKIRILSETDNKDGKDKDEGKDDDKDKDEDKDEDKDKDEDENKDEDEDENKDEDEDENKDEDEDEDKDEDQMDVERENDSSLRIGDGPDGIAWKSEKCQQIWNRLPQQLKNEFKLNMEWMKDFMRQCCAKGKSGCALTTPPNLILPPKKTVNNQYNFGVTIYNTVFNNLPESLQRTYLTFFTEDTLTKAKDYSKLEDVLNDLVAKELHFTPFTHAKAHV